MKCPDCRARMFSDGSHERKNGALVKHLKCRCGVKAVSLERLVAVQRTQAAAMKAALCQDAAEG